MKENVKNVSRRGFLKGAAAFGAVSVAGSLVACASGDDSSSGSGSTSSGDDISWAKEADIVVVGGGASGCATALSGAEAGASVILLESSSALGGGGALCVGSLTTPVTNLQKEKGIQDSVELYLEDVVRNFGEETKKRAGDDWELFLIQANEGGKSVDWLVDHGVKFSGPLVYPHHSADRMHMLSPNSAAWPPVLQKVMEDQGVDIMLQSKGVELVQSGDGRVIGVKVIDQITEEELYLKANKGVMIATASIDASYEQKVKRFSTDLAKTDAACAFNDGRGLLMAARIGGDITEYNSASSFSLRCQAPGPDVGSYAKQSWMKFSTPDAGAVMVDTEGKRFASEDLDQQSMVAKVNNLPTPNAWMVYDDTIAQQFQTFPDSVVSSCPDIGWGTVDDFVERDGILKADTLEELAELMGVNAVTFTTEIEKYNGYAQAGNDPDFGRKKFGLAEISTLNKGLTTPPYYANGPMKGEITQSNLTLAITTSFEVKNVFGEIIPGLYAAGMAGHGLSPLGGGGHGGNMTWAFTSGRLAGPVIAAADPA